MLKVGAVSYINALPLTYTLQKQNNVQLSVAHPAQVNTWLANGIIDVGLVSSASYLEHKNKYELLRGLGIGATKEVMSVCLYTRIKKEMLDGKQIAIPNTSQTSNALLKILCKNYWNVSCDFTLFDPRTTKEDALRDFAAFLLIGDSCLLHDTVKGFERIDLARAWYKETKKPFIFAVFASPKEIFYEKQSEIEACMEKMKKQRYWSHEKLPEIVQMAQNSVNISTPELMRYYQLLDYELSEGHYQGLSEFERLL